MRVGVRKAGEGVRESVLGDIVDYRKSGLSLNHVVGCPLDCGYCVRHLFQNFEMKQPRLIVSDEEAVSRLLAHWAFQPGKTPIQIFNRATDPFLPKVKDHLFRTLELLEAEGLRNHVLVITRWKVTKGDVARLNGFKSVRVTLLVTWSGIEHPVLEPVDSEVAADSLKLAFAGATRFRTILYWRPIVAGFNDTDEHIETARSLSAHAHATVFTGLFYRSEIQRYFQESGVPDLYPEVARRKILPEMTEKRILEVFRGNRLFRKTSCAVAYAHGLPDFNGHFGIPDICDICPRDQFERCRNSHRRPSDELAGRLAVRAGLDPGTLEIGDDRIEVLGSSEQQRYFMQHSLNFQVHDRAHPHLQRRHGRADVGWN